MNPGTSLLWGNSAVAFAMIFVIALGAHLLVESATRLAKRLGVSPLIIGLTIVAFGSSAPEFAVTVIAAFNGQNDISVGNIVGSNVFNLGLVLGGCAMLREIPISPTLLRRDGTVMGVTTILLFALIGWDLRLHRYDGLVLIVLLGLYLAYLFKVRGAQQAQSKAQCDTQPNSSSMLWDWAVLLTSLVCIIGGAHLLVDAATVMVRGFGMSEWIGMTVVAAGTSAPELAISLASVVKGRYDLAVGNVIGSEIFNLMGVLGLAGLLVFLVLLFMRTGWRVSRLEGGALVAIAAWRWGLDLLTPVAT